MELVSDLAQAWINFRLLQIKHTKTLNQLKHLTGAVNADINSLFEDELVSIDEADYVSQVTTEALNTRTTELTGVGIL